MGTERIRCRKCQEWGDVSWDTVLCAPCFQQELQRQAIQFGRLLPEDIAPGVPPPLSSDDERCLAAVGIEPW